MNYKVYILYSEVLLKFYVGVTQDVEKRLHEHLNPIHSKFTSKAEDWKIFLELECSNKTHALKVEKFIKKMKSKAFILSLKDNPEKAKSIIEKFASDC
jgi:putative endonuclease